MRWFNEGTRALVCALVAVGCGSTAQEEDGAWLDWEAGKSDGSGLTTATQNLNAAMWTGYDPVFDRVTPNSCLQTEGTRLGSSEPRFQIPTLRYVETREQLAEELGIDLTLGATIGVAKADFGFKLLDDFTRSENTVAFVVRVTEDYAVLRRPGSGSITLDDRSRELLGADQLDAFVSECGTHYISGVRYGAAIDVLLTFRATDEKHVRNITANLEASALSAPVDLDVDARSDLEEAASGLDISISTSATGFSLSVPQDKVDELGAQCRDMFQTIQSTNGSTTERVDSLLTDLVTNDAAALPRLFSHIDCLKELMHLSIAAEAERCRADGDCGFADAAPREVILEEYRAARAGEFAGKLGDIEAERLRTQRTLSTLGSTRARTRAAYYDEIEPFLTAKQANKALYTTPAQTLGSLAQLQGIADDWAAAFSPTDDRPGTTDRALSEALEDCRSRTSNSIFHRCVPEGLGSADELPVVVDALASLDQYQSEGRIVPLQVVVAPQSLNFSLAGVGDAVEFCEELGPGFRLPNHQEVATLDLLVREGPIPDHTMWVSDDADQCAISGAYYDPTADPSIDCSSVGTRGTVCVAPGGVIPSLRRL